MDRGRGKRRAATRAISEARVAVAPVPPAMAPVPLANTVADDVGELFEENNVVSVDEDTEDDEITEAKKEQLLKMRVQLCIMVTNSSTWDVLSLAADRHSLPLLKEIEEFQIVSLATQSAIEQFFNMGFDDRDVTEFHAEFIIEYNGVKKDFDEIKELVQGANEAGKKRKIKRHISDPKVEHEEVSTGAGSSNDPFRGQ